MAKTGRLGKTTCFWPGMAKTILDKWPVFGLEWPRRAVCVWSGVDAGGGGGDEGLVGPDIRYAVHWPPGTGDDDQRSSDPLHPPLHRDYHLRSRPEPGVGDDDKFVLSALTHCSQAVQPDTVFHVVLRLLLPPSGARYIVGWRLHHPHCPHKRQVDMLDDLAVIEPRKLDRRTIISMKLVADIPGLGLRFIGQDGRPFQPAQVVVVPDQQQ
ncbi:hypothetical protein R6Q57_013103 [Mikania cordata]